MAESSFNLSDLFEQTFGYKTRAFYPEFNAGRGVRPLVRTEFGAYGSEYYTEDALGKEYYLPIKLTYPSDPEKRTGLIDNEDSENTSLTSGTGALKSWYLPYPIISIMSRKTIIETPLTERRGTVKELINIQDYQIVVKGFIIGIGNEFPENEVITLRTIYEQNVAVSIQCPLTDIFLLRPDRSGSDQIVIKELKFPLIPGVQNIRPYELHMVSDEPFNLISIS